MPSRQDAILLHARCYLQKLKDIDAIYEQGAQQAFKAVRQFDADWENIRHGQNQIALTAGANQPEFDLIIEYGATGTHIKEIYMNAPEQIQWLTAGLDAARRLGNMQDQAILLGNLGGMYHYLGDLELAIKYYREHLLFSRKIRYQTGEVNALVNLGITYKDLGDIETAIKHYEEGLEKYQRGGIPRTTYCSIMGNLGSAYLLLGKLQRAKEYLNEALEMAKQTKDVKAQAQLFSNLASVNLEQENFDDAIDGYFRAIQIHHSLGNLHGEGIAIGNLGLAYARQKQYEKAIPKYQDALEIQKQLGNRRGEGPLLNNLGAAFAALGNLDKAIELYKERVKIAMEMKDPRGALMALENLGLAYTDLGEDSLAKESYEQAIVFAQNMTLVEVETRIQKYLEELPE